jgi:hypothetical protein
LPRAIQRPSASISCSPNPIASPERIADALRARDPAIAERLLKLRPNDEILAEAIAQAPVVLGVAGMPVPTPVQPPGVTAGW